MIKESGTVVKTEGRFAWVETQQKSACGSCASAEGCGTSSLASLFEREATSMRVPNAIGARVGQQVTLGLSESGLVRAAFLVYMIPLLGMILGGLLTQWAISGNEGLVIAASLLGFAAGLVFVRRKGSKLEDDPRYQPVMLSIDG